MQIGDLVILTTVGWENIVGVVVGFPWVSSGRLAKATVMWGNTGKLGFYYVERLEVINECR